ncbi:MAG: hypothetical protein KF729_11395 [Sandaracinaceae bacterium]|nr:hypothetical protein [Sandaracinaceae bacterium]
MQACVASDPCAQLVDPARGALCELPPESLEELWRSLRVHATVAALVVDCAPPAAAFPSVGPEERPGVYWARCIHQGSCVVADSLGYSVPAEVVLHAGTVVGYWADEGGAPSEVDWPAPQPTCLRAAEAYPTGRVLAIVNGGDGRFNLLHAAAIGADGRVSGAGTSDPAPVPLDEFRAR